MGDARIYGPQPNFHLMAESFRIIAAEFEKFPNIPAFAKHDAIVKAMEQFTAQIAQLNQDLTRVDQKIDETAAQIHQRIDRFETEAKLPTSEPLKMKVLYFIYSGPCANHVTVSTKWRLEIEASN